MPSPEQASAAFAKALPVVATGEIATARPGQPDDTSATAALASIRQAVDHVRRGRAGAVVTNPIAKSVLYRAGFRHPGHTEFLAELAADGGRAPQPVMMLWSPALAVVPVTIHLSLREALAQLTSELIVDDRADRGRGSRRRISASPSRGLRSRASTRMPAKTARSAREDIDIVAPAVETLRARGHRRPRPAAGGHDVSRRGARDLRLRHLHVSRPGADPDQDDRVRGRRQRHAGPAVRPHLAGPRHGLRHRRHRQGQPVQPRRRLAARRADGDDKTLHERDRRPAAAARRHSRTFGLSARKSLGQNFLLDLNLTARIARAAGPLEGATVIEVGPGPGGLTRALLALGAKRVIAVERDERALAPLDYIAKRYPGRLEIVHADAQRFDPPTDARRRTGKDRRQPALQHRDRAAGRTGSRSSHGRPGTT